MPDGDRPDSKTAHHEPCSREDHEQLKRNARNFRRNTRFVGVQGETKRRELRNCTRCGSTLTAPHKKPGKARRAAGTATR